MEIKLGFGMALCVTSGEGFEKGVIYPIVGWNNGINIVRTDENGDVFIFLACNGGVGKGDLNNFDDSGSPSFREIKETENEDSN